ncbi:MFS family permease [Inhella inkyongensis]|uniref:MFS family permease n=1 Tax=Inhella inkyongensis TaxID=392593 RepID=A0A840S2R8_9BURK|nr:MFS transporter [Inhella inkyongensis]MBB5204033.1 MFS family permease [Inhella inkyongensis]
MNPSQRPSAAQILLCGAAIVSLAMGIRHGFGLWLQPVTLERGWTREDFALALAVQNLAWGAFGPLTGLWADRVGAVRPVLLGALLYALGLIGMSAADSVWAFVLAGGLLIGAAQSGTTYAVVYGVIGRQLDPARRSWAMGVVASAGSFGQFALLPLEHQLIEHFGWQPSLWIVAGLVLLMIPATLGLREPARATTQAVTLRSAKLALDEALGSPSFRWLMAGYFVCGFQLSFIGVHLPSYLKDQGLPAQVGSYALALIGLTNIVGSYAAGQLGQRWPKRYLLAGIYSARALALTAFLLLPLTPASTYVFAAAMGLLWLSTVPPTNATVAQIFGVANLSMLGGLVFFSHQVGSFTGVWLGGWLFERTGSYQLVWWIAVGLGLAAALANLPVREQPLARTQAA